MRLQRRKLVVIVLSNTAMSASYMVSRLHVQAIPSITFRPHGILSRFHISQYPFSRFETSCGISNDSVYRWTP